MEKSKSEAELQIENELHDIVPEYFSLNTQANSLGKSVDKLKIKIKSLLSQANMTTYITDGIIASITTSTRDSFEEDKLLTILKEKLGEAVCKSSGVIKTKEYVDMEILESLVYNDKVVATDLAPCQITKEVVTLNVKRSKK